MNVAGATTTSGAVLGAVVVLLLQQLGLVALSQLLPTILWLAVGIAVGAVVFGVAGKAADRT
jgi:hypothetical protein